MTWGMWCGRNAKVLLDLAKSGVTPQVVLSAWLELTAERGYPIVVMAWVQERIASPPKRRGPKNGCECDLSDGDCVRLHQDGYEIEPLSETIAKQRAAGIYTGTIAHPAIPAQ